MRRILPTESNFKATTLFSNLSQLCVEAINWPEIEANSVDWYTFDHPAGPYSVMAVITNLFNLRRFYREPRSEPPVYCVGVLPAKRDPREGELR